MLMLEDPTAITQRVAIANLPGISVLACGIGSLAQAIGGDRDAARAGAEAGTQQVLVETKRMKIANMLTANAKDVETRVKEGFLALLMQGAQADEAIKIGREVDGMAVSGVAHTGKRVPHQDRFREIIGVWSSLVPREKVPASINYFTS